ncbi:MAG: hypothetical protein AAF849_21740 [Bacteroidota bacterium]
MKFLVIFSCFLFSFTHIWSEPSECEDSISVYIFMLEDCVISQYYTLSLKELYHEFASEQIHFVGVFPNRFSSPETIAAFKSEYDLPFELKYDYYQSLSRKMGATVTPEVVVFDHAREAILYKGRIDNTFFQLGKRRQVTTQYELKAVLQAIKEKKSIAIKNTTAVGCFIKYEKD